MNSVVIWVQIFDSGYLLTCTLAHSVVSDDTSQIGLNCLKR